MGADHHGGVNLREGEVSHPRPHCVERDEREPKGLHLRTALGFCPAVLPIPPVRLPTVPREVGRCCLSPDRNLANVRLRDLPFRP